MSRLTQGGTAKLVSRKQILRRERGQGNINYLCSADHEQIWQPYPVDPYSDYYTYILYLYIHQYRHGGTARPVLRDQILRRERGQGNIHYLCSAEHEQIWQPYPVDPFSDYYTYILYLYMQQYRHICIM